jgi:hypothetical protein
MGSHLLFLLLATFTSTRRVGVCITRVFRGWALLHAVLGFYNTAERDVGTRREPEPEAVVHGRVSEDLEEDGLEAIFCFDLFENRVAGDGIVEDLDQLGQRDPSCLHVVLESVGEIGLVVKYARHGK